MCGIAGALFTDGRPIDQAAMERMGGALAHRGPDGEGFFSQPGAPSVGLVSRRLAVIDIPGGNQPMSIAGGAYTIVYNGEVFNAAELRRELEAAGHRFRSRCDTEVVVRGYAEWGEGVQNRLNGMWAFAIWDRAGGRLFLSRDRLGVKPLVYAPLPTGCVFASEIKALVASGLVARGLNREALPHYLSFFAVPEPHSLVDGVRRLRAGHSLVVDASGMRERRYWDCATPEEEDRGEAAYVEQVEELLGDAVRRRLVSDVPLGVLLSGGIDSGLVSAFAARSGPVRTFTLGFDAPEADEREPARRAAQALGTSHREEGLGVADAMSALPELLSSYDEPGQSLMQTHFICELARREVTVALSGLGGDELFSAYPTHVVANALARFDAAPKPLRELALGLARVLPGHRASAFAALAAMDSDARVTRRLMHQTDAELRAELLGTEAAAGLDVEAPARHLAEHYERAQAHHPLNRLLYVYLKTYLPDELLRAADAMSMAHSLELRTPFLDYRLVELAMRMPARHKMRRRQGKLVLRKVAARVLPAHRGPKRGFSPPMSQWLTGDLEEHVRDVLARPAVARRGIFNPDAVDRIVTECLRGDARRVQPLMMLYCFELWAQRWIDEPRQERPPGPVELGPVPRDGPRPALSVIVVSWNTRERLRACLASIRDHLAAIEHEVIVVDNDSGDGSADMVATEFPLARLIRNPENVGFGRANNQAMRVARGEWFLLLNSDTLLVDDSVGALLDRARAVPDLGVAHCRLDLPDGRLQHTTYRFPSLRLALIEDLGLYKLLPRRLTAMLLLAGYWDQESERDVDWVAGALMLMPRAVFAETGGFDERLFMYGEDMEWCRRIRDRGWRIRYFPQASVVHFDHSSADLRWGDERVALCLQRQQEIYSGWHGSGRTATFLALRLAGAALRTAYFAVRARLGGSRASSYADMRGHSSQVLRALVALALGRS